MRSIFGYERPEETAPPAEAAALRALELDGSLGEAQSCLATIRSVFDWDWSGTEADFRHAQKLTPHSADVLLYWSYFLIMTGRFDEGIAASSQACEIDPLTATTANHLGFSYFLARRDDDAIAQLERTVELGPELHYPHMILAWISAKRNSGEEVLRQAELALEKLPRDDPYALGTLGWALGKVGKLDEARKLLTRRESLAPGWIDPSWAAMICDGLRDVAKAVDHWYVACEQRSPNMVYLKHHPLLDDLRSDARFQALLRRMNFPA